MRHSLFLMLLVFGGLTLNCHKRPAKTLPPTPPDCDILKNGSVHCKKGTRLLIPLENDCFSLPLENLRIVCPDSQEYLLPRGHGTDDIPVPVFL